MFLLLDQNISYRLLARINDIIPNARHIKDLNLWDGSDSEIFMEARKQGYDAILTLDADFVELYQKHGTPPKIIWIRTGNISTQALAILLHHHQETIEEFMNNDMLQCLQIFR